MPDGGATEVVATDLFATAAADDAAFGAAALGTGADLTAAGVDLGAGAAAAGAADAVGAAGAANTATTLAEGASTGGSAATVDAGTTAATETAGGPATTSLAADTAPSATRSLAQQTLESGVPNSAVEGSGFVGDTGSQGMTTDQLAQTGAGAATAPAPSGGIIDRAMDWAKTNPRLASGLLQAGGAAAAGAAIGTGNVLAKQREAELALKNKEAYQEWLRSFVQSGSQGGAGTTINMGVTPGAVLTRPGGAPVYGSNGLIGSRL